MAERVTCNIMHGGTHSVLNQGIGFTHKLCTTMVILTSKIYASKRTLTGSSGLSLREVSTHYDVTLFGF